MTYNLRGCPRQNPVIWIALIALAFILGIGSRCNAHALPGFIAAYAGDTFWASAAFFGFGVKRVRPNVLNPENKPCLSLAPRKNSLRSGSQPSHD